MRRAKKLGGLKNAFFLALIFALVLLLIRPWGEFPLNDDWQYALITKRFFETGVFRLNPEVAPSLLGQSLMVLPVLKIFKFSHLNLRLCTIALSFFFLWAFDKLLRQARVPEGARFLGGLCLIFNPLFLYSATTFMTEIYGLAVGIVAALLWFSGTDSGEAGEVKFPRAGVLIGAALVSGLSFWIRQFSVLVFPALLLALIFALPKRERLGALLVRKRDLGAALAVFILSIAAEMAWARLSGNYRKSFAKPLGQILVVHPRTFLVELGIFGEYMTLFLLPLLVVATLDFFPKVPPGADREPSNSARQKIFMAAGAVAVLGGALFVLLQFEIYEDIGPMSPLHLNFPHLGNVLYNAGIGPLTLSDIYVENGPLRPHGPAGLLSIIGLIALMGSTLWLAPWERVKKDWGRLSGRQRQMILFLFSYTVLSLIVVLQAYKNRIFDRYHFPAAVALCALLGLIAGLKPLTKSKVLIGIFLLLPMAFYAVAGVHDQFRWNQARYELYRRARQNGAAPDQIEGGVEINGWNRFQDAASGAGAARAATKVGAAAPACAARILFCLGDEYKIVMNLPPNYQVIDSIPVDAWLATYPPILLVKRR